MNGTNHEYTMQGEAERILHSVLLPDTRLNIPHNVQQAAKRTSFLSGHPKPFIPSPCKMTESSTALWGLLGTFTNAIVEERYGLIQGVDVDSDTATLYLMSFAFASLNSKTIADPTIAQRFVKYDIFDQGQMYRRLTTNVYPTKDGKWFHLHGSLNATPTLAMLGLPPNHEDLDLHGSVDLLQATVLKHDSEWLDITANERYRQAGTVCLTPEEFLQTDQGKAMKDEPLYTLSHVHASIPAVAWPATSSSGSSNLPLEGIRVLDCSRIIAAPTIAKNLAALGATVIRVSSNKLPDAGPLLLDGNLGKRDVNIDLKSESGKVIFQKLLEAADIVLDGYRPGCLQRLGFSRTYIHELARRRGKGIISIRENCYGWKGPLAQRSGWQQISDCVTGVSWLQGKFLGLNEPVVPLLPNSDYQCGVVGAIAVLHALCARAKTGGSYNLDVSLTQFNMFYLNLGQYDPQQVKELRQQHPNLHVRHYDDMLALFTKTFTSLHKAMPELMQDQTKYAVAPARWGEEGEKLAYLKPCLRFEQTELAYPVGSCMPGSDEPVWP